MKCILPQPSVAIESQPQHQLQSTAFFLSECFFIFQRVQVQFLPSFSLISTSKRAFLEVVYQAQSQRVLFDQFSYNLISFGLSVLCLSFYSFDPFSLSADLVYHQDTYSKDRRYEMDFLVLVMMYFGVFAPKKILGKLIHVNVSLLF